MVEESLHDSMLESPAKRSRTNNNSDNLKENQTESQTQLILNKTLCNFFLSIILGVYKVPYYVGKNIT